MPTKPFFDTNILIYAFGRQDPRQANAAGLVAEGGVVSVQVFNEFIDVTRRKSALSWDRIASALEIARETLGAPVPLTDETHRLALALARRYQLRIYDGLIIASARLAGCTTLCTEDLQHGQTIDGVLVHNPFRDL
jgi:predicted nucleic acid-binding protein